MKKIITALVLVFVFFLSCRKASINHFDLDTFAHIKASDILEKVEIIPLETKPEAMIDFGRKIICNNDRYYILDLFNPNIKIFDKSGNYVRSIVNKGKGPGELITAYDFEVNRFTGNIEIIGNIIPSIVTFDTLNHFIDHSNLFGESTTVTNFFHVNEDIIALYAPWDKDEKIHLYSKKEKRTIAKFHKGLDLIYGGCFNFNIPFGNFNEFSFFTDIYSGTVYQFDTKSKKMGVYKKFDFGKYDFNSSMLPSRDHWLKMSLEKQEEIIFKIRKIVTPADSYFETDKYWLYQTRDNIILYNKKTNKIITFNKLYDKKVVCLSGMTDRFIYGIIDSKNIFDYVSEDIVGKDEYKKLKNLKEEDNQVVIKYYLK
jgi:hypothetical protein